MDWGQFVTGGVTWLLPQAVGHQRAMELWLLGSEAQKQLYLPRIASGEWRLQSMGVTEPSTGTDTTKIKTTAVRKGDRYVINGQNAWILACSVPTG